MSDLSLLLKRLRHEAAVLVKVVRAQGSTPREAGAWMAVFEQDLLGTIGGGHLEYQATAHARSRLSSAEKGVDQRRFALGPSLGQCCGGVVELGFEWLDATKIEAIRLSLTIARPPFALFGGGHVGRAIIRIMADLPFSVTWIDSRDDVFPVQRPANVNCEHSDPVQRAVALLAPGTHVIIMSFSHAEDLEIVAACLLRRRERDDLPSIGLIGSRTKWATFRRRLAERGFSEHELSQIRCPVGVPGIVGKQPGVVAVAVVAQLLLDSASVTA